MIVNTVKNIYKIFFVLIWVVAPMYVTFAQTGGGQCTIAIVGNNQAAGQFRTQSQGINILQNWFAGSVSQTNAQPYIYLDISLTQACLGENVTFNIQEHDSFDPNDDVISYTLTNIQQLQHTLVFRAGDTWCDSGDSGDCDYFLLFESEDVETSFSPGSGGVGTQQSLLNVEYDCYTVCDNQSWQFLGIVNQGNLPSYQYGTFIETTDPNLVQGSGLNDEEEDAGLNDEEEDAGLNDEEEDAGLNDSEEDDFAMTAQDIDCGNSQGIGCIQNPLGSGSNLGTFLENLIAIIIQAGIPLIVLALVYSGLRFVLARGNPEKLVEARKVFLWVLIGSAIILGAWTIATIVSGTITSIIS